MKRIIAFALACVMAFSMVACGEKADERRIANLTEEEAQIVEHFAGVYEGMDVETIKADFMDEAPLTNPMMPEEEPANIADYLEEADEAAYLALLEEAKAAKDLTAEDAAKYAALIRFYEGIAYVAYTGMEIGEADEDFKFEPLDEETRAQYEALQKEGKIYAGFMLALDNWGIENPEMNGNDLGRAFGMNFVAAFEMLVDAFANVDFEAAAEEAPVEIEAEITE